MKVEIKKQRVFIYGRLHKIGTEVVLTDESHFNPDCMIPLESEKPKAKPKAKRKPRAKKTEPKVVETVESADSEE